MAAIKSFTSLEQSKVLAKILPLEGADMEYMFLKKDGSKVSNVPFVKDGFEEPECCYTFIPCWSLAALFDVLPGGYVIVKNYHSFYYVESRDHSKSTNIFDNPVDACVDMIKQLHKLNLL